MTVELLSETETVNVLFTEIPFFFFALSTDVGPRKRPEDSPAIPVWSGCPGSYCVVLYGAGSHVKNGGSQHHLPTPYYIHPSFCFSFLSPAWEKFLFV
ncbi:succinate dehydrogenase cytochrome b560 subunit, mitochondrial [Papio anubis]|uniref:succinate dehydrogenase cytochrome b560 subunit, mitochondrial n=1 Tax=Papio anubis TaxID=9555 RepID=UPI0012AD3097|nr:succinate dehydrogenase cytochrome b560 subunit, mitochondrial [Papio anubis]